MALDVVEDLGALAQVDVDGGQEVVLVGFPGAGVGEYHAGAAAGVHRHRRALAGHHSHGGEAQDDLAGRRRAIHQLVERARPSHTNRFVQQSGHTTQASVHVSARVRDYPSAKTLLLSTNGMFMSFTMKPSPCTN